MPVSGTTNASCAIHCYIHWQVIAVCFVRMVRFHARQSSKITHVALDRCRLSPGGTKIINIRITKSSYETPVLARSINSQIKGNY
ncbi:hypothetical protein SAMN05216317_10256 [Nitrosomonas eutropha]|nr:hypothetical protein SAMN05216379_11371 [Nitrosomonas eutropha]SDW09445.1 hypothetical protein SAMN05216317_10256 [Nitrosomonas eutropha]